MNTLTDMPLWSLMTQIARQEGKYPTLNYMLDKLKNIEFGSKTNSILLAIQDIDFTNEESYVYKVALIDDGDSEDIAYVFTKESDFNNFCKGLPSCSIVSNISRMPEFENEHDFFRLNRTIAVNFLNIWNKQWNGKLSPDLGT